MIKNTYCFLQANKENRIAVRNSLLNAIFYDCYETAGDMRFANILTFFNIILMIIEIAVAVFRKTNKKTA